MKYSEGKKAITFEVPFHYFIPYLASKVFTHSFLVSLTLSYLTLYHTIPAFNDPKEEDFGKHCGKGKNVDKQPLLLFPVFSALSKREMIILAIFVV